MALFSVFNCHSNLQPDQHVDEDEEDQNAGRYPTRTRREPRRLEKELEQQEQAAAAGRGQRERRSSGRLRNRTLASEDEHADDAEVRRVCVHAMGRSAPVRQHNFPQRTQGRGVQTPSGSGRTFDLRRSATFNGCATCF